jgi:hypothetical protein
MNVIAVVFSKDRAMQLDATLRSFDYHMRGIAERAVLFTTSSDLHKFQYEQLREDHPGWAFIREENFKSQLCTIVEEHAHVLFVVDDCLFVGGFHLGRLTSCLLENEQAIGVSLRLGKNTTYLYVVDAPDKVPAMRPLTNGLLSYRWLEEGGAFGYPLEVSSSLYRTADIAPLLAGLDYDSPNRLESALDCAKQSFVHARPELVCFEQSVAFSAPLNKVQQLYNNRAGTIYTPEALAEKYAAGQRIDLTILDGFVPKGCHEEIGLQFIRVGSSASLECAPKL